MRDGGHDAVDAAFRDPPTTSEQILHPELFLDRDEPVVTKVETRPGAGWEKSATYAVGEFDLREVLRPLGDSTAETAARGWDGGEVRSWTRGADTMVAAVLAFDSSLDTGQACSALPQWYREVADADDAAGDTLRGDRDFFALRCDGDRVRFAIAPTARQAQEMVGQP